jgi:hypothetical protein
MKEALKFILIVLALLILCEVAELVRGLVMM